MATLGNYYLNGPSLSTATGIFTDVNLTTCAPDGWYSDGVISRQLAGCKLLAQQNCPDCSGENKIKLQYNATSAIDLYCVSSTNVNAYMATGDVFSSTTQIYQDAGLTTPMVDGFYREPLSSFYREQSLSVLGALTPGPACPPQDIYRSGPSLTCSDFCTINYNISVAFSTVSGNDYFTLTLGDEIVGGLADGWYAYDDVSSSTSTSLTFKIMEIQSNLVADLLECDASNNCQPQ